MTTSQLARALGVVLALAAGVAQAAPPDLRTRLARCDALAAAVDKATVAWIGSSGAADVAHVRTKTRRWLVFLPPDSARRATSATRACESFAIGRAAARARGRFIAAAGGGEQKAFALLPAGCNKDDCPLVVAIRGKAQRPLAAVRTALDCSAGVELRAVKLFDDRDGLEARCRSDSGAGYTEQRALLAVARGELRLVLSMDAGSYEAPSPAEQRAGACTPKPVGSIEVVKRGARPVVRVLEPQDEQLHDGQGTTNVFEWTWDAARRSFVKGKQATRVSFDTMAGCRRKR